MKTNTLLLVTLLVLVSCGNENHSSLNQREKDLLTKEIDTSIDQIVAGWNTNKINTLFPLFHNSNDFSYVGIDGEFYSYKELIAMAKVQFEALEYAKYTLIKKKIKIINQNSAVALGQVSYESRNLKGIIEKYPKVGCTFVFNKIDSKWVVTHFQESTLPGETINPETKN